MKKIYLAGFDVFRADAVARGEYLKKCCREWGFEGLYPLDNAAPGALSGRALAQWIYEANIGLIHQADMTMANLNTFRGAEPDSGTVFEVGYTVALGKPAWVYTGDRRTLVERLADPSRVEADRHVDADGHTVEDFGLGLNLMIACSASVVVGTAEDCLARIAAAMRD